MYPFTSAEQSGPSIPVHPRDGLWLNTRHLVCCPMEYDPAFLDWIDYQRRDRTARHDCKGSEVSRCAAVPDPVDLAAGDFAAAVGFAAIALCDVLRGDP